MTNKLSQRSIFGAHAPFFILVYKAELSWLIALGANRMAQLSPHARRWALEHTHHQWEPTEGRWLVEHLVCSGDKLTILPGAFQSLFNDKIDPKFSAGACKLCAVQDGVRMQSNTHPQGVI